MKLETILDGFFEARKARKKYAWEYRSPDPIPEAIVILHKLSLRWIQLSAAERWHFDEPKPPNGPASPLNPHPQGFISRCRFCQFFLEEAKKSEVRQGPCFVIMPPGMEKCPICGGGPEAHERRVKL